MTTTTTTTTTTQAIPYQNGTETKLSNLSLGSDDDYVTIAKKHNLPCPPGYYGSLPVSSDLREESIAELQAEGYKYMHLLPHSPKEIQPPLVEFKHVDVSSRANPSMKNLLSAPGAVFKELTPPFGNEVHNLQLLDLTDAQRDELALFVAKRGVVVFRNQNIKDQDPAVLTKFGEHFGPLHTHQVENRPLLF